MEKNLQVLSAFLHLSRKLARMHKGLHATGEISRSPVRTGTALRSEKASYVEATGSSTRSRSAAELAVMLGSRFNNLGERRVATRHGTV